MSFREKTAWVTLIAITLVSLMYWFHTRNPFVPHSHAQLMHAMGASIIAYVLIELTAYSVLRLRNPQEGREPKDEREKLIDLKALRVAYYVLATGALCGIFVTLHVINTGPVAMAMAVFLAFVVSQIAKHAARIAYYRRGA